MDLILVQQQVGAIILFQEPQSLSGPAQHRHHRSVGMTLLSSQFLLLDEVGLVRHADCECTLNSVKRWWARMRRRSLCLPVAVVLIAGLDMAAVLAIYCMVGIIKNQHCCMPPMLTTWLLKPHEAHGCLAGWMCPQRNISLLASFEVGVLCCFVGQTCRRCYALASGVDPAIYPLITINYFGMAYYLVLLRAGSSIQHTRLLCSGVLCKCRRVLSSTSELLLPDGQPPLPDTADG